MNNFKKFSLALATGLALITTPLMVSSSYADDHATEQSEEMKKGKKERKGKRFDFAEIDSDGNGSISFDEFKAGRSNDRLAKVDTNGDGTISAEEIAAWGADSEKKNAERFEKAKERMVSKLDTNEDGQIDASELEARQKEYFDKLDENEDGALTEEEIKSKMRKGKKGKRSNKEADDS